jgi:hypothetical protein
VNWPNNFFVSVDIIDRFKRFFVSVDSKRSMICCVPIFGNENFGKFFVLDKMVDKWENRA